MVAGLFAPAISFVKRAGAVPQDAPRQTAGAPVPAAGSTSMPLR
jgi:hypothetical protein